MALEIAILAAAAFVIVFLIIFLRHLFEGLMRLFILLAIIALLVIGAYAFFVYKDIHDLRQNFADSIKTVILLDDEKALAGLKLNGESIIIDGEDLSKISSDIRNKDYKSALGRSYKLIVIDIEIIKNLGEEIDLGKGTIGREQAINVLQSGYEKEKAALFEAILANNVLVPDNPLFFFSQLKDGNLRVYQETALFKAAKIIPLDAIVSMTKGIFDTTKEKAKDFI